MGKNKSSKTPLWLTNLRTLMDKGGYNPRSLSLQAGLNQTAVRDMLEGRVRFPRYDTVQALSSVLNVSPAQLMGEAKLDAAPSAPEDPQLDLMVEIIARLQEVAAEQGHNLSPRAFAVMAATLYRQMQGTAPQQTQPADIKPKIHDLLAYEALKKRVG